MLGAVEKHSRETECYVIDSAFLFFGGLVIGKDNEWQSKVKLQLGASLRRFCSERPASPAVMSCA